VSFDRTGATRSSGSFGALYRRHRTEILTLVLGLLSAWFLVSWALVLQRVLRYYNPFPAEDYWRVLYDACLYKARGFSIFFKPHNEHRIIFPEIVYQLDLLFHGRLILPIVVSFLCYFGTSLMLAWIVCRDRSISKAARAFAALVGGTVLAWQGAAVIVGDPFLLQWTLSGLCAVIAVSCVAISARSGSKYLVTAIIAAAIATYSSGNCLLLWPVLLLEALILRLTRRYVAFIAFTGVVFIALYFVDYHPGSSLDLVSSASQLPRALGFLATEVSMPFGLGKRDGFAVGLGILNILIVVSLFVHAWRKRTLWHETPIVLFCIYLFTLLSAVLTTIGRMNLAPAYGAAKASRYWGIQLLSWADFALLCSYFNTKSNWKTRTKAPIYAIILLLTAYGTIKLRSTLGYDDDQFANRQFAALSFENGLEDTGLTRRIFPDPTFVFLLLPCLQSRHLSVYSLPTAGWLGRPATAVAPVAGDSRAGAVISTYPVESGIEIVGWTEPEKDGSEQIVFLNERREIVGFGRKLSAGFPTDLRTLAIPTSVAWVGFVNLKYGARTVSPFFLSRGRLQPIGGAVPITNNIQRVRDDEGVLLNGIMWHMDPTWTLNGIPTAPYLGNVPRSAIYGSWSVDDHNQGQIESSIFPAPSTGCLLVPVLHGLFIDHASIQILDADSGAIMRSIPMQNGDSGWQFWKLRLEKSNQRIRILARDRGSEWGQWVAIAQPSECDSVDH